MLARLRNAKNKHGKDILDVVVSFYFASASRVRTTSRFGGSDAKSGSINASGMLAEAVLSA